ncbi:MAG: hypothetical protein FD180_3374 [Planctomycetota bacterium]|nr:MAG: hypothetical protein FD180_3374 [Planctomycetota bacterium]
MRLDLLSSGGLCFGLLFYGIVFGPFLLPLACLAWYGQPGPRSSDRRSR